MNSPYLKLIFQLADRWGEPDPRKIAQLPAEIITHWQAFFMPEHEEVSNIPQITSSVSPDVEAQCNDVMRILNG
ncbi:MAG TPA: hypothetical protein DD649_19505 [Providencia sp.]|nr:hypothetical protein [Providencia sp.]